MYYLFHQEQSNKITLTFYCQSNNLMTRCHLFTTDSWMVELLVALVFARMHVLEKLNYCEHISSLVCVEGETDTETEPGTFSWQPWILPQRYSLIPVGLIYHHHHHHYRQGLTMSIFNLGAQAIFLPVLQLAGTTGMHHSIHLRLAPSHTFLFLVDKIPLFFPRPRVSKAINSALIYLKWLIV